MNCELYYMKVRNYYTMGYLLILDLNPKTKDKLLQVGWYYFLFEKLNKTERNTCLKCVPIIIMYSFTARRLEVRPRKFLRVRGMFILMR